MQLFKSPQAIPGVPKIKEKYNPATWMLEVSSVAAEVRLGIDFAEYYKSSSLYQYVPKFTSIVDQNTTNTIMQNLNQSFMI